MSSSTSRASRSAVGTPHGWPSSISARVIQFRRHDSEIPRSSAIFEIGCSRDRTNSTARCITALVDEATGYQEVRARQELQRILDAYIAAELRPWTRMFPPEFFEQVYRMQGWDYKPGTSKRTPAVGKLVNKYVYEQLPDGVLPELQRRNPKTEKGYRRHKHFQFLTADTGNVHLDKQITLVTALMRIARNRAEFEDMFERAFPPAQRRLPLVIDTYDDEDA